MAGAAQSLLLQWDRASDGAEMSRNREDAVRRLSLQWDRASDGAEIRHHVYRHLNIGMLQWDRASDGAEIGPRRQPGGRGEHASMGPRQ